MPDPNPGGQALTSFESLKMYASGFCLPCVLDRVVMSFCRDNETAV